MRLQELMSARIVAIDPNETADTAWSRMQRQRIRHLVVMDGPGLVGVLSERDLGGPNGAAVRRGRNVRELMSAAPAVAAPTTTLRQAANLMRGRLIGSLPVMVGGQVVGIVTATDVLDELGRGATRPVVRAQRQSARVPPASARRASAKRQTRRRAKQSRRASPASAQQEGAKPPPAVVTARNPSTLGRIRVRTPDSPARAPMPRERARAVKRAGAHASPTDVPAFIRATDGRVDAQDRAYLRRKLGRRLGKFAPDVQRVSTRLDDINGPRGGVEWHCRIKVTLRGLPSVVVESREASLQAAMDRALAMAGSSTRRALDKRRRALRTPSLAGADAHLAQPS